MSSLIYTSSLQAKKIKNTKSNTNEIKESNNP